MKRHSAMFAFACMVLAAAGAVGAPKSVSVPAGALSGALEALAKQCGVDVIYPSGPIKGRITQGVTGTLETVDAFRKLIGDAPLEVREVSGALLITQAASPSPPSAAVARVSEEPIPEVEIQTGRDEKLSALRAEIVRLENEFYDQYNKLNGDRQFEVECGLEARTGSHVPARYCQPEFVARALRDLASNGFAPPPAMVVRMNTPGYQKNMVTLVSRNPQLLQILKEHSALVERYEVVRKRKADEKTFAWD